jgi:Sulfotransferase domain
MSQGLGPAVTPKAGRVQRFVRRHDAFRKTTRRFRILPEFLILGAQRAGTTSLYNYLKQHPDMGGWRKEIHFFDERYWRGLDWYRSFFPLELRRRWARARGRDLVCGEATPYYLFHPAVPTRVAASIPDVRLVALLRDPIERAYSHYMLMRRTGRERLSFAEAIAAEEGRLAPERERIANDESFRGEEHRHHSYLSRGLYAEQLERWLEHFPEEQLLVLRAEDFGERPAEVYAQILDHVGLRPFEPTGFPAYNRVPYARIEPALRLELEEFFDEPNARLVRLLGSRFEWEPAGASADSAG